MCKPLESAGMKNLFCSLVCSPDFPAGFLVSLSVQDPGLASLALKHVPGPEHLSMLPVPDLP